MKVFLSYSSKDRGLVTAVRQLLRASNDEVFQDCEDIGPGTRWRAALDEAVARADSMYVFWCRHASRSKEVQKEYAAAIGRGVLVVPVLLDRTPLNSELAAFQRVDFRDVAVHPRFSRTVKIGVSSLVLAALLAYPLTMTLLRPAGPFAAAVRVPALAHQVASLELAPATHTFSAIGEAIRIRATARDAGGHQVPDFRSDWDVGWRSSAEGVASVDAFGTVTAVANGDAEIVAIYQPAGGDAIQQRMRVSVRAPWWSIAEHWLRENGVRYGLPVGALAALIATALWLRRRKLRKRRALAVQILNDLRARSSATGEAS